MKKAYMKTIEMVLVAVLTTIFLLYIIPSQSTTRAQQGVEILDNLQRDHEFRQFVTANTGCYESDAATLINQKVDDYLPIAYGYVICIDDRFREYPSDRMYIDSIYISGNETTFKPKVVRLYHWIG